MIIFDVCLQITFEPLNALVDIQFAFVFSSLKIEWINILSIRSFYFQSSNLTFQKFPGSNEGQIFVSPRVVDVK